VKVKGQFSSLANNNDPIRHEITFILLHHIGLILFPTIALNSVGIQNSPVGAVLVELVNHAFILEAASRLWSFAQLGENFTFAIRKPQCLVKTGIYQYAQHPSYTGFFLLQCAVNLFIGADTSGWLAGVHGDGKD
jgi:protein-S-isoprenylcysteine O-methyltransferase Ste14